MAEEVNVKSYKIINTTVKPKPKTGRDNRTPADLKGHPVSWQDASGYPIGVGAGEMKIVAGPLEPSVLRLAARGLVEIQEISDITKALHDFEAEAQQTNVAAKERQAAAKKDAPAPRLDTDYPAHDKNGVPYDSKASASQMGVPSQREQAERDALLKEHTADNESSTATARSSKKATTTSSDSAATAK